MRRITEYCQHLEKMHAVGARRQYSERYTPGEFRRYIKAVIERAFLLGKIKNNNLLRDDCFEFIGNMYGGNCFYSGPYIFKLKLVLTDESIPKYKEKGVLKVMEKEFPGFIKGLPQAELPFEGLRGWVLQSQSGQVLFNESDIKLVIPEHIHGDQWGIVVAGRIELTISGEQNTFIKGDSYFIPAHTLHSAVIYPGFKAVDYFADKDRYKLRSPGVQQGIPNTLPR